MYKSPNKTFWKIFNILFIEFYQSRASHAKLLSVAFPKCTIKKFKLNGYNEGI